jgi:hypothetical protein
MSLSRELLVTLFASAASVGALAYAARTAQQLTQRAAAAEAALQAAQVCFFSVLPASAVDGVELMIAPYV